MTPSPRLFRLPSLRLATATLLLALAGGFTLGAVAAPREHHGAGGPMAIEQLLAGADVSTDQRAQLKSIMDAARGDLRAEHDAERASRQQMLQLLSAETVDAAAVESLRQDMLARHDTRSRRMTQALLEASAVLSAEQRRQIADKLATRRGRAGHAHGGMGW